MSHSYKRMSDVELLALYKNSNDLTAFQVLFEKYVKFSRIVASEIVEEFRFLFFVDYAELVQIGVFAFNTAVNNFNPDNNTSLKAYWRKIATNEMMNEVYSEFENLKYVSAIQALEEARNTSTYKGFSDGLDGADTRLKEDIIKYLLEPKNRIDPLDARMFLDYLETPSINELSSKYDLSRKTVSRKINAIRQKVITNVLGEDI